jgi:hypothetical protein
MDKDEEQRLVISLKNMGFEVNQEKDAYVIHTPVGKEQIHEDEIAAIISLGAIYQITVDFTTRTIWIGVKKN